MSSAFKRVIVSGKGSRPVRKHLGFCRMPGLYKTAKVAKILMLLNEGKGEELKEKSLAEIEISLEFRKAGEDETEKMKRTKE